MVDVMEYATNKDKTEQRYFVTGVNCDPTTARDEMMIAKAQWNDESEIVCYHGFQSFKHGEVTPEQAHEVGVKLAQKMWGDRFQVIVATHLNTDCLHNHFVVNSVSFTDGKHYHDNKANLRLLRQRSDELCREYALSVIEHPSGKKKPYALYQAEKNGMPTRDNVTRQAVDEAISKSFTLKDFDRIMAEMGYRVSFDPNRKYWTVIGKGWKRPKRLYKLGEEYTKERIMERITENSYAVKSSRFTEPQRTVKVFRVKGSLTGAKKIGGLRGLYLHYCYKLGILPKNKKQNYARLHYLLKDDLMKKLKEQQEEYKRVCGRCYNKKYLEYICVDEMGTLISPHYLTASFPKLLEKNNLRHIRFHDLRHSCASLLLANGVPMKQIQEWLGHSDFSTTANVYAHLDYNSKLSSADAMVNGLSGALEVIS